MKSSEELKASARKALEQKKAAGPRTDIPDHQTAHDGQVKGPQVNASDTAIGKESTWTPNLKRSHVARNGDGS